MLGPLSLCIYSQLRIGTVHFWLSKPPFIRPTGKVYHQGHWIFFRVLSGTEKRIPVLICYGYSDPSIILTKFFLSLFFVFRWVPFNTKRRRPYDGCQNYLWIVSELIRLTYRRFLLSLSVPCDIDGSLSNFLFWWSFCFWVLSVLVPNIFVSQLTLN